MSSIRDNEKHLMSKSETTSVLNSIVIGHCEAGRRATLSLGTYFKRKWTQILRNSIFYCSKFLIKRMCISNILTGLCSCYSKSALQFVRVLHPNHLGSGESPSDQLGQISCPRIPLTQVFRLGFEDTLLPISIAERMKNIILGIFYIYASQDWTLNRC